MIVKGYFKLSRDGSVFKGAIDINDSGGVKAMCGKRVKHCPETSFRELRTAYAAGEIYVSSRDFILLNNKAIPAGKVRA